MQETKSLLHKERLKEKIGKQDFHYSIEEIFEHVTTKVEATENQKQISENQIQALHDSSQTTRQAFENQTRAIKEGIQENGDDLQKSLKQGIQYYAEITNRNNELLLSLFNSNQVDYSFQPSE